MSKAQSPKASGDNKKPVNFRLPEDLVNKLNYIGWHDRIDKTEIHTAALNDYISKWEKKNGAIDDTALKNARIV